MTSALVQKLVHLLYTCHSKNWQSCLDEQIKLVIWEIVIQKTCSVVTSTFRPLVRLVYTLIKHAQPYELRIFPYELRIFPNEEWSNLIKTTNYVLRVTGCLYDLGCFWALWLQQLWKELIKYFYRTIQSDLYQTYKCVIMPYNL
jgi:hypothetical protein